MVNRKTTEGTAYAYEPDYAVPPGRTLQETIDTLGVDQRELARRTGFSAKHVNQMIKGIAPITHETAIRLERVTGVPARMWNNLEANYREQLARVVETQRLQGHLEWLKSIPTKELIRAGTWVSTGIRLLCWTPYCDSSAWPAWMPGGKAGSRLSSRFASHRRSRAGRGRWRRGCACASLRRPMSAANRSAKHAYWLPCTRSGASRWPNPRTSSRP